MEDNWNRQKLVSKETREDINLEMQRQGTPEALSLRNLLSINQNIAWSDGVTFDQLVLCQKDGHVLGMVKGERKGVPVIAYVATQTYAETLETVGEWASRGILDWKPDKWPSRRLRQR